MKNETNTESRVVNLDGDLPSGGNAVRGKFVLVDWGGETYLVFGPLTKYAYHAELLAAFCAERYIPSGWEHRPDHYAVYTADVKVRGGGHLRVWPDRRRIEMFGQSTAYGPFHRQKLARLVSQDGLFSDWEVEIRRL